MEKVKTGWRRDRGIGKVEKGMEKGRRDGEGEEGTGKRG